MVTVTWLGHVGSEVEGKPTGKGGSGRGGSTLVGWVPHNDKTTTTTQTGLRKAARCPVQGRLTGLELWSEHAVARTQLARVARLRHEHVLRFQVPEKDQTFRSLLRNTAEQRLGNKSDPSDDSAPRPQRGITMLAASFCFVLLVKQEHW